MERLRLLIADENKDSTALIRDYISYKDDMVIVAIARDGESACKMIDEYKPDVVVMELILPYIDGLEILKRYQNKEDSPSFIIISLAGFSRVAEEAFKLDAKYYVVKPFNPELLYKRIKMVAGKRIFDTGINEDSLSYESKKAVTISANKKVDPVYFIEQEITKVLYQIGIPSNIKGFKFIREAILLVLKDDESITSITKEIYPIIAGKFFTSRANVERAIRHSIDLSWEKGSHEERVRIFGKGFEDRIRVKNAEAISVLASKMEFILREKGLYKYLRQ